MPPKTLIDPFGRTVDYIRVSVTDRCDFRCVYCMAEHMTFLPKAELLSLEELEQVCRNFMALGTRKIRLTGGEPLVRRNIMHLIRNLGSEVKAGNLDELTITTNGSQLHKMADELIDAGVKRLNISIDTLDPDRFREITRWGDLDNVLGGLEAAKRAGLAIKLNAVALKGVNELIGYYSKKYKKVTSVNHHNKGAHVIGHYADGAKVIGLTDVELYKQLKRLTNTTESNENSPCVVPCPCERRFSCSVKIAVSESSTMFDAVLSFLSVKQQQQQ